MTNEREVRDAQEFFKHLQHRVMNEYPSFYHGYQGYPSNSMRSSLVDSNPSHPSNSVVISMVGYDLVTYSNIAKFLYHKVKELEQEKRQSLHSKDDCKNQSEPRKKYKKKSLNKKQKVLLLNY